MLMRQRRQSNCCQEVRPECTGKILSQNGFSYNGYNQNGSQFKAWTCQTNVRDLVRPMYVYVYDVRMVCLFVLSVASVADMSATGLTYGSLTSPQLLPPGTP